MRVYILGINHQIQKNGIGSYSTDGSLERFEKGQKEQWDILLQKEIDKRGAEFIGEEARHGWESIADAVCRAKGCHYANIEIPPNERANRQIPNDYESDENKTSEQKKAFHEQREQYMFDETLKEAGAAQSIIVICGRYHTAQLAQKFRDAKHEVEEGDLLNEGWYVEDWQGHMMRL